MCCIKVSILLVYQININILSFPLLFHGETWDLVPCAFHLMLSAFFPLNLLLGGLNKAF